MTGCDTEQGEWWSPHCMGLSVWQCRLQRGWHHLGILSTRQDTLGTDVHVLTESSGRNRVEKPHSGFLGRARIEELESPEYPQDTFSDSY